MADEQQALRQLKSRFSFQMRRFHLLYTRASTLIYADRFGLTNTQCRMIAEMLPRLEGPMPLAQLISEASIDNAVATRTIDSLVAKGLVVRSVHPGDGRVREIAFTDKGREVGRAIQVIIEERDRRLMARLDAQQQQVLHAAIDELIDEAEHMLADERGTARRGRRRG
ncbi:MAG: MarR family winged helix-turn-helix transcriptional regulator [Pigmentiphaga sp.]